MDLIEIRTFAGVPVEVIKGQITRTEVREVFYCLSYDDELMSEEVFDELFTEMGEARRFSLFTNTASSWSP